MFLFSAIFVACVVQPLLAFPYCLLPWKEGYPRADAPTTCNDLFDCAGADNPICTFSNRNFRKVCCQNTPPSSEDYMEPPLCPAGYTIAGEGIQCKTSGPNTCPTNTRCMQSASFANVTGIYICCRIANRKGPTLEAFETEGVVPTLLTNCPSTLPSGASFSVAFDTVTLTDGQRFSFNDTNRSKVFANTFKVTYTYPRTKPLNSSSEHQPGSSPGEQFLLIILQPDSGNRLKPLKRSVPAFVAELTLAQADLQSGTATIEFTQSTPSPIVTASLAPPTPHPAQPYNRYVILLFKKSPRPPISPPTIKEFGETLDAPFKIPTAAVGLWNVKGYIEKLAIAKYIESTTPIAGLVYLVQSTAS